MPTKRMPAIPLGCDQATTPLTSIRRLLPGSVNPMLSSSAAATGGCTCNPDPPKLKFLAAAAKERPVLLVMLMGT